MKKAIFVVAAMMLMRTSLHLVGAPHVSSWTSHFIIAAYP